MSVYRPTYADSKTGRRRTSKVWWFEFTIANRRIRKSAHTTRKTIALEAEKQERLRLEKRLAGMPTEKAADRIRTVSDVLKAYKKAFPVNHRPKSVEVVKDRSAHLERLLSGVLLPDLTSERILEYMRQRQKEGASGRAVNMELGVLSRAMESTWRALWPKVKRLDERSNVGRALDPDEERAILDAASQNRSRLLYPFLMVLTWTGMRSDEARMLRWSQVDFDAAQVTVGKAKTHGGTGRVIPLSAALKAALGHHAAWLARKLGPIQPDWFVFPASSRTKPVDPSRPVRSLKRGWDSVRTTAKVSCRLHDLRHSFCTKLAEAGVSEGTMLDMMGHVSTAMLRRYSHIRKQARRDAIDALENGRNSVGVPKDSPKVIEASEPATSVTH